MYFLVLPQQSTLLGLYRPVLLCLLGNTGKYSFSPQGIRSIYSLSIDLLGKPLLELSNLDTYNVFIMTRVVIYVEIKPEPFEVLSGAALGNSLRLRLYLTVNPSSCFDTDTICKGSQSEKILLLLVANWTVGIVGFCFT